MYNFWITLRKGLTSGGIVFALAGLAALAEWLPDQYANWAGLAVAVAAVHMLVNFLKHYRD